MTKWPLCYRRIIFRQDNMNIEFAWNTVTRTTK